MSPNTTNDAASISTLPAEVARSPGLSSGPDLAVSPMIVIVEDQPEIRAILQRTFETRGFAVSGYGDGVDGFRGIVGAQPDAVILDLELPGLTGLEILEAIRKASVEAPVVLLTASADRDLAARARLFGPVVVSKKPFSPAALAATVVGLIADSRRGAFPEPDDPAPKTEA